MIRIRRIYVLALILIALIATVTAPRVLGQDESKALDHTTRALRPNLPSPSSTEVRIAPAISDPCNPNFWIVSSRHCRQDFSRPRPCCRFRFAHYNGCHRWSNEAEFLASLQNDVPICIVVHGSFVRPEDVVPDSVRIYRWIRAAAPEQPLQLVFYTWPSGGITTLDPRNPASTIIPTFDIVFLGSRAEFNGFYLASLITRIPGKQRISIFGHSHGTRVTVSTLHLLGGGQIAGRRLCGCSNHEHRIRAVLAAAAIDHDWMNPDQRYRCALRPTECLLNLQSRHDIALKVYPLQRPFARRALGRTGFQRSDRAKIGWQTAKITELNVTPLIQYGHMIPHYYNEPRIATWMSPWLYFSDDDKADAGSIDSAQKK